MPPKPESAAVRWARELGLILPGEDTQRAMSRAEMAEMLLRFARRFGPPLQGRFCVDTEVGD